MGDRAEGIGGASVRARGRAAAAEARRLRGYPGARASPRDREPTRTSRPSGSRCITDRARLPIVSQIRMLCPGHAGAARARRGTAWRLHPAPSRPHRSARADWLSESGSFRNDLRSALALGVLATGLAAFERAGPALSAAALSALSLWRARLLSAVPAAPAGRDSRTTTTTISRRTSARRRGTIRLRPAAIAARSPMAAPGAGVDRGRCRRRAYGTARRRSSTAPANDGYAPPPPYGGRRPIGNGQPEVLRRGAAAPSRRSPTSSSSPIRRNTAQRPNQADPAQGPMQLAPGQARAAARRDRHGAAEHGRDAAARGSARDRQVRASGAVQAPARARSSRPSRPARS